MNLALWLERAGKSDGGRPAIGHGARVHTTYAELAARAARLASTLRDRFHLPESKSAIGSQIIAATTEVGLIKLDEKVGTSRRFARYLPFWA